MSAFCDSCDTSEGSLLNDKRDSLTVCKVTIEHSRHGLKRQMRIDFHTWATVAPLLREELK